MLWGYSNRTHGATGTLDPLMAKAVVLESGDQSVAIVSLDLGRTPEESVLAKVREQTTGRVRHLEPVRHGQPHASRAGDGVAAGRAQSLRRKSGPADRRDHLPGGATRWCRCGSAWGAARPILPTTAASSCPTAAWPCNGATPSASRPSRSIASTPTIRLDRADGSAAGRAVQLRLPSGGDGTATTTSTAPTSWARPAPSVEEQLKTKCLFLQGGCGNINPYMDKTPLDQGGVEEMQKMGRALGELLVKTAARDEDRRAGPSVAAIRGPRRSRCASAGISKTRRSAPC